MEVGGRKTQRARTARRRAGRRCARPFVSRARARAPALGTVRGAASPARRRAVWGCTAPPSRPPSLPHPRLGCLASLPACATRYFIPLSLFPPPPSLPAHLFASARRARASACVRGAASHGHITPPQRIARPRTAASTGPSRHGLIARPRTAALTVLPRTASSLPPARAPLRSSTRRMSVARFTRVRWWGAQQ
jgi:hypothetical protein